MTYGRMTPTRSSGALPLPADPGTAHNEAGREERGAEMDTELKWEEREKRGCLPFAFSPRPIILLLCSAHKHSMHAPEVQRSRDLGFQVQDYDLPVPASSITCLIFANQPFLPEAPKPAERQA